MISEIVELGIHKSVRNEYGGCNCEDYDGPDSSCGCEDDCDPCGDCCRD